MRGEGGGNNILNSGKGSGDKIIRGEGSGDKISGESSGDKISGNKISSRSNINSYIFNDLVILRLSDDAKVQITIINCSI